MKVKIFDFEDESDLEDAINNFLEELEGDVVEIKYQVSSFPSGEEQIYCFSAMIIYYSNCYKKKLWYNWNYVKFLDTLAEKENKKIKSSYYRVNKANPLYNRLVKYKQNHLYFIEDFNIPFDNNLSERDLRIFKNKTKISGGFRSMSVAQNFANTLSIIKTSIKRKINPYYSIKAIFNSEVLFAN